MLLIRHTAVVAQPGTCYGQSEVPVAATFPEEADALVAALQEQFARDRDAANVGEALTRVLWTSPAARCRVVADALRERWHELDASECEPRIAVDERLAELNFGKWEGRHWDTLRGPEVDAWMRDPWRERPPGGETAAEMWTRVAAFRAEKNFGEHADDLVITHAGVIRAWRSIAERRDWRACLADKIPFGSVWKAG